MFRWDLSSWFADGFLLSVSSHGGKGPFPLFLLIADWGPAHLTLFNYFLKTLSPGTVMLVGRASTCEFFGTQFSPQQGMSLNQMPENQDLCIRLTLWVVKKASHQSWISFGCNWQTRVENNKKGVSVCDPETSQSAVTSGVACSQRRPDRFRASCQAQVAGLCLTLFSDSHHRLREVVCGRPRCVSWQERNFLGKRLSSFLVLVRVFYFYSRNNHCGQGGIGSFGKAWIIC